MLSLHHGSTHSAARHSTSLRHVVGRLWTLDGLVDGQDQARGFTGGGQGVDLDDRRLPDTGDEVIGDVFLVDVDSVPNVS